MVDLTSFAPVIVGRCSTNIDKYRGEDWPEAFVAVPKEGDMVSARSGVVLWVCSITHRVTDEGSPYIKVELNKQSLGWDQ